MGVRAGQDETPSSRSAGFSLSEADGACLRTGRLLLLSSLFLLSSSRSRLCCLLLREDATVRALLCVQKAVRPCCFLYYGARKIALPPFVSLCDAHLYDAGKASSPVAVICFGMPDFFASVSETNQLLALCLCGEAQTVAFYDMHCGAHFASDCKSSHRYKSQPENCSCNMNGPVPNDSCSNGKCCLSFVPVGQDTFYVKKKKRLSTACDNMDSEPDRNGQPG